MDDRTWFNDLIWTILPCFLFTVINILWIEYLTRNYIIYTRINYIILTGINNLRESSKLIKFFRRNFLCVLLKKRSLQHSFLSLCLRSPKSTSKDLFVIAQCMPCGIVGCVIAYVLGIFLFDKTNNYIGNL